MDHSAAAMATAFAHGDRERLEAIGAAHGQATAMGAVAACLERFLAFHARERTDPEPMPPALSAAIDRALAADPGDSDLLMCVLCVAVHRAFALSDIASCERLVARARALAPHCQLLRSRAVPWRLECWLGVRQADVARQLRACDAIAALPGIEADEDLVLEFSYKRLLARLRNHDLAGLEPTVDAAIAQRAVYRTRLHIDPLWLRPACWLLSGEYDRVLEQHPVGAGTDLDAIRLSALLGLGRVDEADAILAAYDSALHARGEWDRQRSNAAARYHEAAYARELSVNRLEAARRHMRLRDARLVDPPRQHKLYLQQALAIELADGDAARARACLEKLDPRGERGDLHVEWCRLHLLEGENERAATRFAQARAKGLAGYLEHQLRCAYELRAHVVAWLMRQQAAAPVHAPAQHAGAPSQTALIGDSPAMAAVRSQIRTLAPLPHTVLITGETGTGKEVVARLVHEQGAHPQAPFLPLNCAAMPDALAESELFGHRRGAFTGADRASDGLIGAAGEGTIFLDEIASMSQRLQGVLLRVLETGDYRQIGGQRQRRCRARFVVASNRPLLEAVNTGEFRADLYYRLERFTIALPPLRVRLDDLSALCSHFIAQATGGGQMRIGAELLARLRAHTWPGNVRELRNEIERLAILNPAATELGVDGSILPQTQTPAHVPAPASAPAADGPPADDPTLPGPPRARRRRTAIIQLLRHRGRLYRTEVIEHVGCAPATATADLRALIECGLIRRVETSGHLRTSYFVLA